MTPFIQPGSGKPVQPCMKQKGMGTIGAGGMCCHHPWGTGVMSMHNATVRDYSNVH